MDHQETILILDYGGQYTQLIARRVRESNVYCEIHPFNLPLKKIQELRPRGIIFSGGPQSVFGKKAPRSDPKIFELKVPVLGICYGLQLIAYQLGGKVDPAARREYGRALLEITDNGSLFSGVGPNTIVWMNHGDHLTQIPPNFKIIAHSMNSPICAIADETRKFYGIQFHPEVHHTPLGKEILRNFLYKICGCSGNWTSESFIESTVRNVRDLVGNKLVVSALSGGVDSSVVSVLLHQAIGDQLHCIFVDNGLLRKNEAAQVIKTFREYFHINLHFVDASKLFLSRLAKVKDPERKRKIIGKVFIEVFEKEAKKIGTKNRKQKIEFLAQGTLYPDVIESVSFKGPSATIKSHHNVGGLPAKMKLKLIEPVRELFKDEVRAVGRKLGIPEEIIGRHPFPGPGLAIRVLGEITKHRLEILREADAIFIRTLKEKGLYQEVWQAFAVILPVQAVGVMGDARTYENVVALRAVTSVDGMTADWAQLPHDFLADVANQITNEVRGVNRVVYDVTSKPPGTIEWE